MLLDLENPQRYFVKLSLVLIALSFTPAEPALAESGSGGLANSSSNIKSPPYGEFSLSTYKWEYAPWMRQIAERIKGCSDAPRNFLCDTLETSAEILITVMPDGKFSGFEIVESVGDTNFTIAALECIQSLESPGPLPDHFPNDSLELNIGFKCNSSNEPGPKR